jgi:hypothetical protein
MEKIVKLEFLKTDPLDLRWDEIPFYRKRWFCVMLTLLFWPGLLFVGLQEGDIFALHEDKVYKVYPAKNVKIFGLISIIGVAAVLLTYLIIFIIDYI